nr:MAG TPA: Nickel-responsive regulator/DNA Complex, protein-DNA complex, transcription factor.8A [Caudoviricetes sp.]
MATEKPRYSITLDDEMFKEIEDFRFEQRYPNRNQATIELIRLGLEAMKKQQEEQKRAQKSNV